MRERTGYEFTEGMPAPEGVNLRLFEAVMAGEVSATRAAVQAGADVNGLDLRLEGRTPLNVAVESGHLAVAKCLLKAGARVYGGPFSNPARAFERDDIRMLAALVEAGADPNDFQDQECPAWKTGGWVPDPPLVRAARRGRRKMAAKLLELGADPNRLDHRGFCALAVARLRDDRRMMDLLLPVTAPALRDQALKALDLLAHRKRQDRLIEAAGAGDVQAVRKMLADGAEADGPGEYHRLPATIDAAWRGHLEVLKLLVEAGASPHGGGDEPLLPHAARCRDPRVAEFLIRAGADVNVVDGDFGPPILEAAALGNVDTLRLLLAHRADPGLPNAAGQTAFSKLDDRRRTPIWERRRADYEEVERVLKDAVGQDHAR